MAQQHHRCEEDAEEIKLAIALTLTVRNGQGITVTRFLAEPILSITEEISATAPIGVTCMWAILPNRSCDERVQQANVEGCFNDRVTSAPGGATVGQV